MKVGIFGGTFDPPHLAHEVFAHEAKLKNNFDELWILPAGINPFKLDTTKTERQHRLNMCKVAFPEYKIITHDIEKEEISYAIETLTYIKKNYSAEYWWVAGSDILFGLHKWKNIEILVRECRFAIGYRPGYNFDTYLKSMPEWLKCSIDFFECDTQLSMSSTYVRQNTENLNQYVSPGVEEYIKKHDLYSW